MTAPYRYLVTAHSGESEALLDELCTWHDRMVAHLRRLGLAAACGCTDPDECPRHEAADLWARAGAVFGTHRDRFTFLRRQVEGGGHA